VDRETLEFAVRAFVAILAVVDPLGNVAFFMPATEGMSERDRHGVALRACLVAAGVLIAFAAGGSLVLWAFNLSMPAVMIGGGIVLLVIALQMLSGRQFDWERDRPAVKPGQTPERASIVPLAIPLVAGPGAMSSVIALTAQRGGTLSMLSVMAAVVVVCAIQYVCYMGAVRLLRRLGRTAMVALSCLMGIILAALAVQFMLNGLRQAAPGIFKT
jgi:multiple antibiotic resistance protein